MKKYTLFFAVLLAAAHWAAAQAYWSKRFDVDHGNEYGSQVTVLEDGYLVFIRGVCGFTVPPSDPPYHFCYGLLKFDLDGEKKWQTIFYDTISPNALLPMVVRRDTAFVLVDYKKIDSLGYAVLFFSTDGGAYLGRHDFKHPSVEGWRWSRNLRGTGDRLFAEISYRDTSNNQYRHKVLAFGPDWDVLWEVAMPADPAFPRISAVNFDACPDGGVVIACASRLKPDSVVCNIYKYDADGGLEWGTRLDGYYRQFSDPITIHAHPDGGYMGHWLTELQNLWYQDNQDTWFKLDAEGNIQWQRYNDLYKSVNFVSTFLCRNGDMVGCGTALWPEIYPLGTPTPDTLWYPAYIARVSPQGEARWERYIYEEKQGAYLSELYHGAEAPEGCLVFTGVVWDTLVKPGRVDLDDVWLLKLDSNGCMSPGCGKHQHFVRSAEPVVAERAAVFKAYPNPFGEGFTLGAVLGAPIPAGSYGLSLSAPDGRLVLSRAFNPEVFTRIEAESLPAGQYTLVIQRDGAEVQTLRLMKVRR